MKSIRYQIQEVDLNFATDHHHEIDPLQLIHLSVGTTIALAQKLLNAINHAIFQTNIQKTTRPVKNDD